jgi:hypothetical protein
MVTILLMCLVNNEKNTLGLLAISKTMRMRRCNLERIAKLSTTRASGGATERLHWAIIRTVLPLHVCHGHRRRQHPKHN